MSFFVLSTHCILSGAFWFSFTTWRGGWNKFTTFESEFSRDWTERGRDDWWFDKPYAYVWWARFVTQATFQFIAIQFIVNHDFGYTNRKYHTRSCGLSTTSITTATAAFELIPQHSTNFKDCANKHTSQDQHALIRFRRWIYLLLFSQSYQILPRLNRRSIIPLFHSNQQTNCM